MSDTGTAVEAGWGWGSGIVALAVAWTMAGAWMCRSSSGEIERVFDWFSNPSRVGGIVEQGRLCWMEHYSLINSPGWSYAVGAVIAVAVGLTAAGLARLRRRGRPPGSMSS